MSGKIIDITFMNRDICIYLPPSYDTHRDGFPVVYIQDWGYLFRDHLGDLEEMVSRGELRELIFVGIRPENRNNEYTPWYAKALSDQYEDFGGQGADYLAFLVNDLKPYIDRKYRTLRDADHTGIAGASLGGLISMYATYLHPEVFGRIASISGSFWYEGFIDFMRSSSITHYGKRLYLDVGRLEGVEKENIQRNMVAKNKDVYQILLHKGFSEDHCRLIIEEGAVHDHAFFLRRFPGALQWLFSQPGS